MKIAETGRGIRMSKIAINQLIKTLEDALAVITTRSDSLGITLMKAEVELSAVATYEGGSTVKFDWFVSVEAGTKLESSNKHVLSLSLVPKRGILKLGEGEVDELANAILALAKVIREADQTKFVITEGKVEVKFVATQEGKLKVVVGGGTKFENAHSIKLSFQRS
jgi:hypothetical protein